MKIANKILKILVVILASTNTLALNAMKPLQKKQAKMISAEGAPFATIPVAEIQPIFPSGTDVNNQPTSDKMDSLHNAGILCSLFNAVQVGDIDSVNKFIDKVTDINMTSNDGKTLLFAAVQEGHIKVIEALLSAGADPNKESLTDGSTPLFEAVRKGRRDIVEMLFSAGARIYISNKGGLTPLDMAVQKGYADIVDFILSYNNVSEKITEDAKDALILSSYLLTYAPQKIKNEMGKNGTLPASEIEQRCADVCADFVGLNDIKRERGRFYAQMRKFLAAVSVKYLRNAVRDAVRADLKGQADSALKRSGFLNRNLIPACDFIWSNRLGCLCLPFYIAVRALIVRMLQTRRPLIFKVRRICSSTGCGGCSVCLSCQSTQKRPCNTQSFLFMINDDGEYKHVDLNCLTDAEKSAVLQRNALVYACNSFSAPDSYKRFIDEDEFNTGCSCISDYFRCFLSNVGELGGILKIIAMDAAQHEQFVKCSSEITKIFKEKNSELSPYECDHRVLFDLLTKASRSIADEFERDLHAAAAAHCTEQDPRFLIVDHVYEAKIGDFFGTQKRGR